MIPTGDRGKPIFDLIIGAHLREKSPNTYEVLFSKAEFFYRNPTFFILPEIARFILWYYEPPWRLLISCIDDSLKRQ